MTLGYRGAAFILAAGKSTRMASRIPKVLLPLGGRALIDYPLEVAHGLAGPEVTVVVSPTLPDQGWSGVRCVVQPQALGTGNAFFQALQACVHLQGDQDIVVLFGDCPLIQMADIHPLLKKRALHPQAGIILLGFYPTDPTGYGRLVTEQGRVKAIIEEKEACPTEKQIGFCYTGIMLIKAGLARQLTPRLPQRPLTGEYYLTDLVALAVNEGHEVMAIEGQRHNLVGVNTRTEWQEAEMILQKRFRARATEQGAFLYAPQTTFLSYDTQVAEDVHIHPHVYLGPGVVLDTQVTVQSFSHLSHCHLKQGTRVGPFAHIHHSVTAGPSAVIGNFVEVKKSSLGPYAKAKHLAYVGDATLGPHVNMGAGSVICNYDGHTKHTTHVEAGALIGSNSALVAPVHIGENATVGAGSIITHDVPAGSLATTRAPQRNRLLPSDSKHLNRPRKET